MRRGSFLNVRSDEELTSAATSPSLNPERPGTVQRVAMGQRNIDIDPSSGDLRIRFDFDRRVVARIKAIPRRRWSPEQKAWFVPIGEARALVEVLREERFTVSSRVRVLLGEAESGQLALEEAAPVVEAEVVEPPVVPEAPRWSPSQINTRARLALTRAFPDDIWVVGEISGWDRGASRRRAVFFELVEQESVVADPVAKVSCVLFERDRAQIEAALERAGGAIALADGVQVCIRCRVDLYPAQGRYQLIVRDIDPTHTLGALAQQRAAVLHKLRQMGLAERNLGLSVALVPLRVGLVTSVGSDAYNDVVHELRRSGYGFSVCAWDAHMQGRHVERTVLAGLRWFAARKDAFDVVAIVRGGGARTDLSWFDTLLIGMAVAELPIPVLCGIGHQQDRSVVDEIARSLKTPTAVGKFLVDAVAEFDQTITELGQQVASAAQGRIKDAREGLREAATRVVRETRHGIERGATVQEHLAQRLASASRARSREALRDVDATARRLPEATRHRLWRERAALDFATDRLSPARLNSVISSDARLIDELRSRLDRAAEVALTRAAGDLDQTALRLRAADPATVLRRGFALVRDPAGRIVRDPSTIPVGAALHVTLAEGPIHVMRTEAPTPEES